MYSPKRYTPVSSFFFLVLLRDAAARRILLDHWLRCT
jgi:hypothetical protein